MEIVWPKDAAGNKKSVCDSKDKKEAGRVRPRSVQAEGKT